MSIIKLTIVNNFESLVTMAACISSFHQAPMDSPGGEFNSYKSKHLGQKVFQTSKNIVIVEDFRITDQ